jgi:hypothetical protein
MKLVILATTASFLLFGNAVAQDNQQKIEVQPGDGPTESITKEVPTMKNKCPDQANAGVNTQAPGTEATEATGSVVPNMKPDSATDCPESNTNTGGG